MNERVITNCKCRAFGRRSKFDWFSLLQEMTVRVGRVRSLRVEGYCQPIHNGVPPLHDLTGETGSELAFPSSKREMT
ncbi:hypothetical protein J6590_094260 [Homalodisca vitripennis]|nr:hypothetical protein J6590_094260 [Homalodisca vitripennis]